MDWGAVARHAEWFRAVILLDTFCFPVNMMPFLAGMLKLVSSRVPGALLVDHLNLMVDQIPSHGMKLRTLSVAELAALRGPVVDRARRPVMREPAAPARFTRLLPGLEATFARHDTRILEGAGHFSEEDAPDQIIAAIRDWPVLSEATHRERNQPRGPHAMKPHVSRRQLLHLSGSMAASLLLLDSPALAQTPAGRTGRRRN